MKNLVKTFAVLIAVTIIGLTSCQKTDFDEILGGGRNIENPKQPGDDNSDDSGNSNGDSKGLHSDVPVISGLSFLSSFECNGGEKRIFKNSSDNYQNTIDTYVNALKKAGFTNIGTTQGGGWGSFGGRQAWGYKGGKYVKINAQVQQDKGSVVYVCAWPSKPIDDNCHEDCN